MKMTRQSEHVRGTHAGAVLLAIAAMTQPVAAATLNDYLFVATGLGKDGDGKGVFDTSSDEYGAIGFNKPSGSSHDQPSIYQTTASANRPTERIDQSGDVAILQPGAEIAQLSSTRIHIVEGSGDGDGNGATTGSMGTLTPAKGSRGFDCAGPRTICNGGVSGNSVPSSSDYNLSATGTSVTPEILGIDGANDAMYYNVDLADVATSIETTRNLFLDISATLQGNSVGTTGYDVVLRQDLTEFSGTKAFDFTAQDDGFFVLDLKTSADKWELSSNTLSFDVNPEQYVVLLLDSGKEFSMTSSALFETGGDQLNNIAVFVDGVPDQKQSFSIQSSMWNGVSFYDFDNDKSRNLTYISSSVGCGHFVNDHIQTTESSFTQCAFDLKDPTDPNPTVIPIPAAAWLFGSALMGMVGIGVRRRGRQSAV